MTYPPQPQFSQPSAPNTGDKFEAHEHKGSLLLVYPKVFQENIKTTKGLSDAADVDIIVVDKAGPDGRPLFFSGARLFGNLARSVRNELGGQVLGRLNQITSANGNTPWILENFNDQDAAAADPVHRAYQQGQFRPTPNPMQQTSPQGTPAGYAPTPQTPASPPAQQQWQPPAASPAAPPTPAASQPAWNAPVGAPPPAAPAAQWNAPPAAAQPPSGAPAVAPQPAAAAVPVDPGLVQALQQRGITLPPGATQQQAEAIWASVAGQ